MEKRFSTWVVSVVMWEVKLAFDKTNFSMWHLVFLAPGVGGEGGKRVMTATQRVRNNGGQGRNPEEQ